MSAPSVSFWRHVLREKLLALLELQKVDVEIATLKKSAEAYPKEIAEVDRLLTAERGAVDLERAKLDDLEKQRITLEQTIAEDKDKVRKWETRLTEQRSTREYSALAREIDIAKKGQQTMAEEVVELGKQAIIQREAVKSRHAEFETKAKALLERSQNLKAKLVEVEQQISGIDEKRSNAAKAVDGDLLRRYDNVRKKRMPAVVAATAPGTCTGCRMSVRSQVYNMMVATRGVDSCPSCQRIVYADEVMSA